ncbi:MAG: gliding motility-associated protein GldE [Muribaculaceae bacterium]|nr:gliding motility-associated protein GldE [Muribaculaceae bacterium]
MDPDVDPLPSPYLSIPLKIFVDNVIEFHAPDDWVSWCFIVFTAAVGLIVSAFVSGSEIAYFGLSPAEVDDLYDNDSKAAIKGKFLINHSERLLASILVANNLVNITIVILLNFAINRIVTFRSPAVDFICQTVVLTFLLLLFGEIFPKLVARNKTLKWVLKTSPTLTLLYKITSPVASFMVKSSALFNRFITKKQEQISTDELEKALSISDIKEAQDKEMLEGILSFGEKEAGDIMISRVDVTAIEFHDSWSEAVDVIIKSGYSRIPVYDTSQDVIKGILYSKDLLPYIGKQSDSFRWQTLIRDAYFVPETRRIDDLLEDFRKRKIHIAIVVDEYGGTQGIVTLEDIIEEIVGEIDDEYDEKTSMYKKLNPDTYLFDAKISLGDFSHIVGIDEEELGETGEAETLAGLLLEIKGDFPTLKETIVRGPCRFQVTQIEKHRITKVKVWMKNSPMNS